MPNKRKKIYITTPIYYVNAPPHLGHAYTTIAADILARFYRFQKRDVFFLTGTDEHGIKIEKAAQQMKKTPQKLCNENAKLFKKTWRNLNISYDNFVRTTNPHHIRAVQKVLQILYNKKLIYKGIYKGLYCVGCEQYKTKMDLINGKCPDHQIEPETIEEENYFFRLSQFHNLLLKKITSGELEILPEKRKIEIIKFLQKGLKDISISRPRKKVKWGIPLPFDKKHTTYVWIDAFLSYLTGIGWNGDPKNLPTIFPPDLQLMGKDILRVHATIWPVLLLAVGIPLPKKLFVHGHFTVEGQKMSKSLGNVIRPEELIEKFGADATRYLLISACSFGEDGDISWKKLTQKYNSDLANGLGNLVARIIMLAGKVQNQVSLVKRKPGLEINRTIESSWKNYENFFNSYKLDKALSEIWKLIDFCEKYIEKNRPWEHSKKQFLIINDLLIVLTHIAKMLQPFLPNTSKKIFKALGIKFNGRRWYFKVKPAKIILFPRVLSTLFALDNQR